jgi:hypothetical protein
MMRQVTIKDAIHLAQVVSGRVDPALHTMFSIVRNEMGFLPAWLAHYRAIGFEQFLIFDDGSDDGSGPYLEAQPDVVLMRSDLRFGDMVLYTDPDGHQRRERAGTYFKIALPHLFFDGQYVAYVDADEFLILPPGVTSIAQVIARLAQTGVASAVASVVEFFPAGAAGLQGALPQSFDALVAAYPYFQPEQLVALQGGTQPQITGQSKTARLFKRFGIKPQVVRKGWHRIWLPRKAREAQGFQKSPRHKTPLVRRDARTWLTGSHYANLPPSDEVLLCVAHFVFTAQFADKIDRARAWGAHANGAAKYGYYAQLLERIGQVEDGFLDAQSQRYNGPEDLVRAGLIRW